MTSPWRGWAGRRPSTLWRHPLRAARRDSSEVRGEHRNAVGQQRSRGSRAGLDGRAAGQPNLGTLVARSRRLAHPQNAICEPGPEFVDCGPAIGAPGVRGNPRPRTSVRRGALPYGPGHGSRQVGKSRSRRSSTDRRPAQSPCHHCGWTAAAPGRRGRIAACACNTNATWCTPSTSPPDRAKRPGEPVVTLSRPSGSPLLRRTPPPLRPAWEAAVALTGASKASQAPRTRRGPEGPWLGFA